MTATDGARLLVEVERRRDGFHLDVQLEAGTEVLVLFGASGAGKSSTLNAVAGLQDPDFGHIRLDGECYFRRPRPPATGPRCNLPTRRRGVGYVFQNYALFPHLSAEDNVAFALRRDPDRQRRAHELLDRMGLLPLAGRYPDELSGGQQQRVAIARALAPGPRVLLLDEPFAALDLALKGRLQSDLHALQRELALVVLYVTHSLDDAFAIGDRLAVIQEGRVRQVGSVEDVSRHPVDAHVAGIVGVRNLFSARVTGSTPEGLFLDWDGVRLETVQPLPPSAVPTEVTVYIHPEDIKIIYPGVPLMEAVRRNLVEGRVVGHRRRSGTHLLVARLSNGCNVELAFQDHAYAGLTLEPGETVQLSLRRDAISILRPPPLTRGRH